ncbi:4-hydroxythreonine-4-phosphate dehydrogenase PdxA [Thiovibrio sp. JS02]
MPETQAVPIGITMGCPVGIGPEIILRFLAGAGPAQTLRPVILGDAGVLRRCAVQLGLSREIVVDWQPGGAWRHGAINVLSLSALPDDLGWGNPTAETGRAMGSYIEEAVRLARAGELAAMVTCPIGKTALRAGGYDYPGHTEMLADLCQAKDYAMMMAGGKLRVTLVTIHQALARVPAAVSEEAVLRMIAITGQALRNDFALQRPRLAVAGLNPHAGENCLFGDEEVRIIAPAVAAARRLGWQVEGPLPPDTVFHKAVQGRYDAVVAMYHDQGLIPFKLLHFSDGVNVTLGLPIVRTSVDHGTAYDIVGRGLASSASLSAAFFMAAEIAANRKKSAATAKENNGR